MTDGTTGATTDRTSPTQRGDAVASAARSAELLSALGDEVRLRVLALLLERPRTPSDLSDATDTPPRRLLRVLGALRTAGLARPDERDGAAPGAWRADLSPLHAAVEAQTLSTPLGAAVAGDPRLASSLRLGRLQNIPAEPAVRAAMVEAIAGAFPDLTDVPESRVNAILATMVDDVTQVRRLLVEHERLERTPDGARYSTRGARG